MDEMINVGRIQGAKQNEIKKETKTVETSLQTVQHARPKRCYVETAEDTISDRSCPARKPLQYLTYKMKKVEADQTEW